MSTIASAHNLLDIYFSDIRALPRDLGHERESKLAVGIRDGKTDALRELVESNLGFVVKLAFEHRNRGLEVSDLINEGNLGLIRAALRFDPSRKTKFITYAVFWIKKAMLQALADHASTVRVPDSHRRSWRESGRDPHAHGSGLALFRVSLDSETGSQTSPGPLRDRIADPRGNAEAEFLKQESSKVVGAALADLSERERQVLRYRYGLDDEPRLKLAEIGTLLGLSRERVRQIERGAKERLKRSLMRRDLGGRRAPAA